jgi:hypothetical protein
VIPAAGLEQKRTSTDPIERAAALSYHPAESGDVVVVLIFMGAPFKPGRYSTPASPADLAVTLASLIKLPMPGADGKILTPAIR